MPNETPNDNPSDHPPQEGDAKQPERTAVVPTPALVFRCPKCNALSIAEGFQHIQAISVGVKIDGACSECKALLRLHRGEEKRITLPHEVGPPGMNRKARRSAGKAVKLIT